MSALVGVPAMVRRTGSSVWPRKIGEDQGQDQGREGEQHIDTAGQYTASIRLR